MSNTRSKKQLPPEDARHGTPNGYGNWGCRCEPCTAAHAVKCYERRQARAAKGVTKPEIHGTPNGYGNYGCRCEPCTKAWSARCAKTRAAARDRRQNAA